MTTKSLGKSRFLEQTVVTAGSAKAHPYLPMGRDIAGPDTTARHGPRTNVPRRSVDNLWKGGGMNGERVSSRCTASPASSMRIPPTFATTTSHKEWDNQDFNGVTAAARYAKYIKSGQQNAHCQDTKPSYKIKKLFKKDAGRVNNQGGYAKQHVGMDTKSTLTFGRA